MRLPSCKQFSGQTVMSASAQITLYPNYSIARYVQSLAGGVENSVRGIDGMELTPENRVILLFRKRLRPGRRGLRRVYILRFTRQRGMYTGVNTRL